MNVAFEQIACYLREEDPSLVESIVIKAQLALKGKQVLPGTQGKLEYIGSPPDWTHNKFNDKGYVWTLNRMQHWRTLAQAYLLTGEQSYVECIRRELADWIARNPCPPIPEHAEEAAVLFNGLDGWRQLEVGFRMCEVWPFVLTVLKGIPGFLDMLEEQVKDVVRQHGVVLRQISPMLFPNADHNFYFTQMAGLLSVSILYPDLPDAKEWRKFALDELDRGLVRQFTAEGGQVEGCPHYHNAVISHLSKVVYHAMRSDITFSPFFLKRMKLAVDYAVQTCRPTGAAVPWGDSDPDEYPGEIAWIGALIYGTHKQLQIVQGLMGRARSTSMANKLFFHYPELFHLLRDSDQTEEPGNREEPPRLYWHKELKQVTMRSDWSREAYSVFFACRLPVYNSHAHVDPASFDFTALGKALVIDPGRYGYWREPERRHFKSGSWHNTILINGNEPFEYVDSWTFGPQESGWIEGCEDDGEWLRASAVHYSYKPSVHRRELVLVPGRFLAVLDTLTGLQHEDIVSQYWHLDAEDVRWDDTEQMAASFNKDVNVAVYSSGGLKGELLPGLISEAMDHSRPSVRLELTDVANTKPTRRYATIIVPYRGQDRPLCKVQLHETGENAGCVVAYKGELIHLPLQG
ncbi:alginate lyase family protein [Paenibacillus roseipurpureus]|uniref:Alginate lyase family protein n=1 Tax=Paenibacillus roseopurpureus TaxID=2918901 RepID=A0AA96RJS6_9BACL|nr:alginate lyase family protein [Paenibacillus sp. MBLB1832]WNR45753.1 alginate lyase family protein [Paenibacillus sp. MBLB1832]